VSVIVEATVNAGERRSDRQAGRTKPESDMAEMAKGEGEQLRVRARRQTGFAACLDARRMPHHATMSPRDQLRALSPRSEQIRNGARDASG
jgi:hypothetical protein